MRKRFCLLFGLLFLAFLISSCGADTAVMPKEGSELQIDIEGKGDVTYLVFWGADNEEHRVKTSYVKWHYDVAEDQDEYAISYAGGAVHFHLHESKDPELPLE